VHFHVEAVGHFVVLRGEKEGERKLCESSPVHAFSSASFIASRLRRGRELKWGLQIGCEGTREPKGEYLWSVVDCRREGNECQAKHFQKRGEESSFQRVSSVFFAVTYHDVVSLHLRLLLDQLLAVQLEAGKKREECKCACEKGAKAPDKKEEK